MWDILEKKANNRTVYMLYNMFRGIIPYLCSVKQKKK